MTAPIPEAAKLRACELANACETTANWHIEHLAEDRFVTGSMLALARHLAELSEDMKRVHEILEEVESYRARDANAIACKYVLPDPADPLLIEARKLVAAREGNANYTGRVLDGDEDDSPAIKNCLIALRRGIELGKSS